ncbi:F-box/FBD/LRR-repeat protein [Senna tora]|uniref:F-box/FBD/LRR-repeat protein n=1 Tax=Senna tora TaxID=362788 RepID=A0A834TI02_9FABA|nr:F-box/FBD/LRR-repeat protein [Senna tora]
MVNIWFSAILNRRVRKFIIHGSSHKDFSSQPLFSCKSLVELVLNISCYLRVPADVNLPNLETLDLSGIRFTSNLNELVLSFPLLKKFECQNCTWSNVQNVSLQVPALEVVVLKFGGSVYVANTCTIKFCNSRLTDFSYDGSTSQDYVLLNPPSDIHVFINILVPQYRLEEEEEKEISLRACMLLKQFSQVEYLKLGQTKVFAKALGSLEDFPAFMMLRHLELGYVTGEMLLELLLKSPNLTTLDIKGISEFETELLGSAFVPHCLSSTLEVVKLGMHKGHDFEFCVAKFVMEHALVLKRLSFSWYSHQLKCKTKRVKDKLFSFKKASNTAIIEFS